MPPKAYIPEKKGEINELKSLLRDPSLDRDVERKREVIKKVIAFMTMGVDVSRLFSDMIMATNTRDVIQKKLIYLYITQYAQSNAEISLLAINTLQKDCRDENPLVRGLALRSLASLRLANITEYLIPVLINGIQDPSPYVRRAAVMGSVKLYHTSAKAFRETILLDRMQILVRDSDAEVSCTALVSLLEVLGEDFKPTPDLVLYLLNRIHEFNEWHQCNVLGYISMYTPSSEDELFDILNLLDERLKHANSAIILATSKCFLHLTQNSPEVHSQVYDRIKDPLLTLAATGTPEISYAILSQIKLLVQREPAVWNDSYKDFFIRYTDSSAMKALKLELLTAVAADDNAMPILSELSEYVSDIDAETSRRAIRAIGSISVNLTSAAPTGINYLLTFLSSEADYIRSETMIVFKDLLRKYKDQSLYSQFLPAVTRDALNEENTDAKCSVIWIIGEHGESVENSPYLLEEYVERYGEEPASVQTELLTSCAKLFFKRPAEMHPILGKLFETALSDYSNVNVRDRALYLHRLLQFDLKTAARIVAVKKDVVSHFSEEVTPEFRDRLLEEFNTLSVVYGQSSDRFIVKAATYSELIKEEEREKQEAAAVAAAAAESASASAAASRGVGDDEEVVAESIRLLGDDASSLVDLLPDGPGYQGLELAMQPRIDPPTFQSKWSTLPQAASVDQRVRPSLSTAQVEAIFLQHGVACLASGVAGTVAKFYMFAQRASSPSQYFLMETLVTAEGGLSAKIKADMPSDAAAFADIVRAAASSLQ